ncbi:MmgE/PrpD family protein [Parasphingorhabdus sp. JC815]|uniref:MmgE/PrpD family protein n=1 Tax=Parasphingorhabdus sp. JC815 TaxID=3232140 RepID=UPI003459D156
MNSSVSTKESLTQQLSAHLMRPIDDATRQRARYHLLDWLGCVAGAIKSEAAGRYLKHMDQPESWLGNILEMDDVHRSAILHPGPVIWPSALKHERDLEKALNSAIIGYEAMICVGATFDSHHYSHYHPTATAGFFGAAATHIHRHLGQDIALVDDYASAMGLAGTVSGGLWQTRHENDDAKQFHVAHAIETGERISAYIAGKVKGSRFILEGPQGLYAATCNNTNPMRLDDQWRIHEVSFKPWGACRHAHPAIDAALELKRKTGKLTGEIRVESYADAIIFCDRPDPQTVLDAKFSLQHALAVVAERGVPTLSDFEPDAIKQLASARTRVKVSEASDITSRYPQHYGARITCDGETYELADTLGDPERSMSEDQIIDKARQLIAWGGLADKEADRAIDLALKSDDSTAIQTMLKEWLS